MVLVAFVSLVNPFLLFFSRASKLWVLREGSPASLPVSGPRRVGEAAFITVVSGSNFFLPPSSFFFVSQHFYWPFSKQVDTLPLVSSSAAPSPLLFIETSGDAVSLLLRQQKSCIEVSLACSGRHHERLLPALASLLGAAGLSPAGLGGVVVGIGPGGFTSVRAGVTTAVALASSLPIPLFAASSLAVLSAGSPADGELLVLSDARRGEVYCALFDEARPGLGRAPLCEPALLRYDAVPRWLAVRGCTPVRCVYSLPDAARREVAAGLAAGSQLFPWHFGVASARGLERLHALGQTTAVVGPLEPLYLRASDAKLPAVVQRPGAEP